MPVEPPLPRVSLPVQAQTPAGDLVRLRRIIEGESRPDTSSGYDDWGVFDIRFEEDEHDRAMVELRPREGADEPWIPVGDMSWHSELHGPNLGSRAISIGIALHAGARGRGIGAVAQSLLAAGLHQGGVHRVQASTDVANVAEQRSLERAGYVREGVARGAQWRADGRHDLVVYACLPGEPAFVPL